MMSILAITLIICGSVLGVELSEDANNRRSTRSPVYRYWNSGVADHFYTTNNAEIGAGLSVGQTGNHGYVYEGIGFYLSKVDNKRTVPLYRYYSPGSGDHFYTTNEAEIGTTTPGATGNHGYRFESTLGYCFENKPARGKNIKALYRYYQPSTGDHFYTTNADEIGTTTAGQTGNFGYRSEGTQCYVYSAAVRTISDEMNDAEDDIDFDETDLESFFFGAGFQQPGLETNNWMNVWIAVIGSLAMIIGLFVYYKRRENKKLADEEAAKALLVEC